MPKRRKTMKKGKGRKVPSKTVNFYSTSAIPAASHSTPTSGINVNENHAHSPLHFNTHCHQGINVDETQMLSLFSDEPSGSMSPRNVPSQSQGTSEPFMHSQSNGTNAAQVMNSQMPNHGSGFETKSVVVGSKYMIQQTTGMDNLVRIRQGVVHTEASCSENPEAYNEVVTENPDYSSNFGMDLTEHNVDLTVPRSTGHQTGETSIQKRPRTCSFQPIKYLNDDPTIISLDSDESTDSENKIYSDPSSCFEPQPSFPQNKKKGNLIRDQLLLYLHASSCQMRLGVDTDRECSVSQCNLMRKILTHLETCDEGESCSYMHCSSTRLIRFHWQKCSQTNCLICQSMGKHEVFDENDEPSLMPRVQGTEQDSVGQTVLSFGRFNRSSTCHSPQPSTSYADAQTSGTCIKNKGTSSAKERSLKLAELPNGILDNLWKVMECCTCFDIPEPPIFMCSEGHHICKSCEVNIPECPLCRGPVKESRIRLLESALETMPLPCPNRVYGCQDIFYLSGKSEHVLYCRYQP